METACHCGVCSGTQVLAVSFSLQKNNLHDSLKINNSQGSLLKSPVLAVRPLPGFFSAWHFGRFFPELDVLSQQFGDLPLENRLFTLCDEA